MDLTDIVQNATSINSISHLINPHVIPFEQKSPTAFQPTKSTFNYNTSSTKPSVELCLLGTEAYAGINLTSAMAAAWILKDYHRDRNWNPTNSMDMGRHKCSGLSLKIYFRA